MSISIKKPSNKLPMGGLLVRVNVTGLPKKELTIPYTEFMVGGIVDRKAAKAAAEKAQTELKEKMRAQAPKSDRSLTICTIADALDIYAKAPKKNGAARVPEKSVLDRINSQIGSKYIYEAFRYLSLLKDHMEEKGLSNGTINRHISMVKAAVSVCHNTRVGRDFRRLIPENYLSGFPTLPENNISYRILSNEERLRFWNALRPDYRPLYYFALHCPVRISEMVNLRTAEQVNRFSGFITLAAGTTKNKFGRTLAIPEGLKEYALHESGEFFFHRDDGKPLGWWHAKRDRFQFESGPFEAACEEAKISDYTIHKTRQEACLIMVQQGMSVEQIKMIGGWKSDGAFQHYFNKDIALQISIGAYKIDLGVIEQMKSDLRKAA